MALFLKVIKLEGEIFIVIIPESNAKYLLKYSFQNFPHSRHNSIKLFSSLDYFWSNTLSEMSNLNESLPNRSLEFLSKIQGLMVRRSPSWKEFLDNSTAAWYLYSLFLLCHLLKIISIL